MRPKIIFCLLAVVECFLLGLIFAPGVSRPKNLIAAQVQYVQSPSAETKKALEDQQAHGKMNQVYVACGAAGVLALMIFYGWKKKADLFKQ